MKDPTEEEKEKAANEIADLLMKEWDECQAKMQDDDDPEELFKYWIIEKLARAIVATSSSPSGEAKPYPLNRI